MRLHCLFRFGCGIHLLIILFRLHPCAATSSSLVGINYGRVGNNLPAPSATLPLLASIGVGRIRLYDADPSVLHAFANTGIELIVGLPDRCVPVVSDPNEALSWVQDNIKPFVPATKIAALTVGNEVLTSNNTALAHSLLPAMESLHSALVTLGLDHQIVVTTAHSLAILSTSYPPSSAVFRRDLVPYLCPIIAFHAKTNSPFLVNAYTYFAYADDPSGVDIAYALLESNPGVTDPVTGLRYANLLLAQVDAVYHAITAAAGESAKAVEVRVSETGWPSAGDPNETGATPANAAKYNRNVMKLVAQGKGTPLRPGLPVRAYVFALFNENLKPGPTSERNYGLFKPDGTPAYPLGITVPPENSTTTGGGGGGGSGGGGDDISGGSDGFYSISAAPAEWTRRMMAGALAVFGVLTQFV
ncbi:glucan endo-1,3-beta-glucosidase 11-like [Typha angustifolia]|uniref:glucan endo-1,3-beta-glucosidase 11-like n=1 Tax=Typha angustifolia TaxID=59011 RepID=UPI003C2C7DFF